LEFRLRRLEDWRRAGWVTADTHVHFLSPETARLEAQAEGINIVNLLVTQWGDLFTNVGDFTGSRSGSSRDDTIVWVGTENRHHFLGHMSLLGATGDMVSPLCSGGPSESFLGDPTRTALAEWADASRAKQGLVVIPHFPHPLCEVVADVVLGKVDGLEIRDFRTGIDTYAAREWYRFLNCGYRVAAVGGTDKMSAGIPVGGVRTYAQIGDGPLSFEAFAEAVRAGRTFTTSGPLLTLTVDGVSPGGEVTLGRGGRTLAVEARALCAHPLEALEIVHDGAVVAREESHGAREVEVKASVAATRTGWIAARCVSPLHAWHVWPIHVAAHTSPVYLLGATHPAPPSDIAYLTTILEGGITWLNTLATEESPARHRRLRAVFETARRQLSPRPGHARPSC